jgi:urease accessory protein UreF
MIHDVYPSIERILSKFVEEPKEVAESEIERRWREADTVKVPISCQTAPLIDLLQGCHDSLYSRLFNS